MAKAIKSAAIVAQKWAQNTSAATASATAGANAVTESPGQAAVAQQQKMKLKLNAAIDSGKWAARTGAVTAPEWRKAYVEKGIPRMASGSQAAQPKVQAFMTEFLPVAQAVSQEVASMPKLTLEDSLARVRVAVTRFSDFGKNRK